MAAPEERFLSTEEVAERLQVDEQTVRRWIKSGKLEAFKPGREWRIPPAAFEALLESYSSPKALSRPEFFELPGLDAALKRQGMSRSEHAFRAGMTPGEVLDYEIGAKSPSAEIIDRLADALGAAPHELAFPPEQVEAHRIQEERDNALLTDQRLNTSAKEIREEWLRNPGARRIRAAVQKNEAERQAKREDDTA